jgi:hypothetical protein
MSFLEEVTRTLSMRATREEKLLKAEGNIRRYLYRAGDEDPRVLLALRKYPAREMNTPNLFSDEQLAIAPCRMVLVGGAGAGKSFVLCRIFSLAARQIRPDRPVPFLLDLDRDLGTDLNIRASLERVYGKLPSSAFQEHEKGCFLLLDSLEINPRVIKRKMSKWKKKRPEHRHRPPLTKTFLETVVMTR